MNENSCKIEYKNCRIIIDAIPTMFPAWPDLVFSIQKENIIKKLFIATGEYRVHFFEVRGFDIYNTLIDVAKMNIDTLLLETK